jgi:hypothetical protein
MNLWSLWTCYTVNLLYCEFVIFVHFLYYKFVILVNFLYCELVISWIVNLWSLWSLSTLLYYEVWYIYRLYFRFQPLPVYFPHQTFVSDVSEIPISFSFPELPFSILFPIKNMKTVMVLVFTDHFWPFSSLPTQRLKKTSKKSIKKGAQMLNQRAHASSIVVLTTQVEIWYLFQRVRAPI